MRKIILAGIAAAIATALLASPAFAWHSNVSGNAGCKQTTVTVTVPDEDWVTDDTTASGTVSLAGQSKPWQVSGAGTDTVVFGGVNGGHATVTGTFNTGESAGGSADIAAVTDCEVTTTTNPPVDKPDKPKPQVGTPTHRARKAPAYTPTPAGNTPAPVAKQPKHKPGQLPFTGAGEQAAMFVAGLVLVGAGLLVIRRTRPN